ncbi:MAG TPA: hypothetical protein VIY72_14240 [Acidimicrobiales bacterium]
MTRNDPFRPVLGDDIGPTGVQRARSGVVLAIVLVLLGIVAAVALGVIALVAWTLLKTALG